LLKISLKEGERPYIKAEIMNSTPLTMRISRFYDYKSTITLSNEDGNRWFLERDSTIISIFDLETKDCTYQVFLKPYQTKQIRLYFRGGYQFTPIIDEDIRDWRSSKILLIGRKSSFNYSGIIYLDISDIDLKVFKSLPVSSKGRVIIEKKQMSPEDESPISD
jgi:hypothetical protein